MTFRCCLLRAAAPHVAASPQASSTPSPSAARSCCDGLGELGEQRVEVLAEELAGPAEAAALAEGRVEQLSRFDGQRGGEVVADEASQSSCSSVKVRPAFCCWRSQASNRSATCSG